jgi:hypothetical protein
MIDLGYILVKWELEHGWHDQPRSPRLFREARLGPKRQSRFAARLSAWLADRPAAPGTARQEPARPPIREARHASRTGSMLP